MAKTLLTCDLSELEAYGGMEMATVRANAPHNVRVSTIEAARREGFLPTERLLEVPGTSVTFRFYAEPEVQAFYDALANGWTPAKAPKLTVQFRNLSQENYDKLVNFAANEGIDVHTPTPRKSRSPKEVDASHIEVVEDDDEYEAEYADDLVDDLVDNLA